MKKIIFTIISVMAVVSAMADNTRYLGYTVTDDIDVNGGAFGQAGTYSIGALLPSNMLASYQGCRIIGVRFALSKSIGRTRAFMYDATNNMFTEISAQKQRTYEGWNSVIFNGDGYVITGTEDIFFGFDYVETEEMVAAEEGALCGVGNDTNGAFYLFGNYGQGEGLYSISGIGRLCVQLIVDVSSLPLKDIDLTDLGTGHKYKEPDTDIDAYVLYNNTGRDTIFQYRLAYQLDDNEPVYKDFADTLLCAEEEMWEFTVHLPADIPIGMHTLKAFFCHDEGEIIEKIKNDTLQASFAIYRNQMQRHQVYVEVYSNQQSPYTAMLDKALNQLVAENPNVALVNTFAYGNPLFLQEADYLHLLYAYDYPTFTFNRAHYPGEPYIAYDMNYYLPQIPASFITGILSDMLVQDFANPAFASIELSPTYDANSRELKINITGETLAEAEAIYGDIALTVLLTEDGVKSPQSVYNEITQRTTTQKDYVHNQVLRQFVSAPVGDPLTIEEGTYQADYTLTLPEEWNPENMHIVAFITKAAEEVTDDNVLDMDITNANSCAIPFSEPTGIRSTNTADQEPEYFSLDGMRLDRKCLRPGIVIMRNADGTARKVSVSR